MTESEIFEAVTGSGSSDFATVARILNQQSGYCLIGGLAVNCYVEPVYTLDADIVVATPALGDLAARLREQGFKVNEHEHSLNALAPESQLRIQFTTDERYQTFLSRAVDADVL